MEETFGEVHGGCLEHFTDILTGQELEMAKGTADSSSRLFDNMKTQKQRDSSAKDLLRPLVPTKREYGREMRRRPKKSKREVETNRPTVVIDLPLDELLRVRCESDPAYARKTFATHPPRANGDIGDLYDTDNYLENECLGKDTTAIPIHAYIGL